MLGEILHPTAAMPLEDAMRHVVLMRQDLMASLVPLALTTAVLELQRVQAVLTIRVVPYLLEHKAEATVPRAVVAPEVTALRAVVVLEVIVLQAAAAPEATVPLVAAALEAHLAAVAAAQVDLAVDLLAGEVTSKVLT